MKESRHCQHQGGKGLRMKGKVSLGELLINIVTVKEPKVLIGSNQKVRSEVCRFHDLASRLTKLPVKRKNLTLSVGKVERGNPVVLLERGRFVVKQAESAAGVGCWKKRRMHGNRAYRE